MGPKRLLFEIIPAVIGLKPAVDAFRVAGGAKMEEGQLFDPMMEMVSDFVNRTFRFKVPLLTTLHGL